MRQFVKTLKSLYENRKVDEKKIIELFECKKITEQEKREILSAH